MAKPWWWANNYNDSISVIDTATKTVRYEHDLRPYYSNNEGNSGVPGGEYPLGVVIKGNGTAYVSSFRDREVVVVDVSSPTAGKLITRIKLDGNGNEMTLDKAQANLYVAQENADEIAVIDTSTNKITARIDARAPSGVLTGPNYTGAATFAVRLSPDGKTLYAVNDGSNSIAVIPLTGSSANTVTGLIPTAYAPKDITFSPDGTWMYIINGKSDTGPNPKNLMGNTALITNKTYPGGNTAAAANARAANQYQFQLEHATLVSAQVPTSSDLSSLTSQVAKNNLYGVTNTSDAAVMSFLHEKVQHIIYIVKENRTFDQILGDLTNGADADPSLVQFGQSITPNFHKMSRDFVTLDNFMDPGDGSMDGWSWSMRGRVTSTEEVTQQINYAAVDRGLSYESEGSNRNVPIGLADVSDRDNATAGAFSTAASALPGGAANLLPGTADVSSTDAPFGVQKGHIVDAVLQAGLTVRNYGWQANNIGKITDSAGNPIENPGVAGVVQVAELNPTLVPYTDVYFRGFDMNYSDQWDVNEWMREFEQYIAKNNLPSLETVRLSHDHTGSFSTALAGVNTPDTQEADNDLAVGRLIAAVAHSPYANNTVIIVTEDDCQDGPDHVDSHRSTTYVVGAYVKRHAVINTRYNQVSVLRTIEDILGTPHINLNTAYQPPMADVFDPTLSGDWNYNAVASTILKTTSLAMNNIGVQYAEGPDVFPRHDAAYWAKQTRGFDFSEEDRVPVRLMNEVMWAGLMDGKPYPAVRSGKRMGTVVQVSAPAD
jgi:YVTN family beta-propeller protein